MPRASPSVFSRPLCLRRCDRRFATARLCPGLPGRDAVATPPPALRCAGKCSAPGEPTALAC
eukprot:5835688-Pleurochrysis_carterae.AAC.1